MKSSDTFLEVRGRELWVYIMTTKMYFRLPFFWHFLSRRQSRLPGHILETLLIFFTFILKRYFMHTCQCMAEKCHRVKIFVKIVSNLIGWIPVMWKLHAVLIVRAEQDHTNICATCLCLNSLHIGIYQLFSYYATSWQPNALSC